MRYIAIDAFCWELVFANPDSAETAAQIQKKWASEINNPKWEANAINMIGITWYFRGDYEKTEKYWVRAMEMRERIGDKAGLASSYNNMCNLYTSTGKYDLAMKYLDQCIELDRQQNNLDGIAKSFNNKGLMNWKMGRYSEALDNLLFSVQLKKRMGDELGISESYVNIGGIYDDIDEPEKALEYYLKSVDILEKNNHSRGLGAVYANMGQIYEKRGELDLARSYLDKSLMIRQELSDVQGISNSYNTLSGIEQLMGNYENALDYNKKALSIQLDIKDTEGAITSYAGIGSTYFSLGSYHQGIENCAKGLELARSIGFVDKEMECHRCLYLNFRAKGNDGSALYHYEQFNILEDSLLGMEQISRIAKSEAKFEYELAAFEDSIEFAKEKEIASAHYEKQVAQAEKEKAIRNQQRVRQNILIVSIGVVLGIVGIFALFLYNRFKITSKQKDIIASQKLEVEHARDEIVDSIRYAKRIQEAILPSPSHVKAILPDSFIFYRPKDVVSGDFYFVEEATTTNTSTSLAIFAAADCTGHGVPGAFMSIVGNSYLMSGLTEPSVNGTSDALNYLNSGVYKALRQDSTDKQVNVRDGMDIALCAWDKTKNVLHFSGAKNPLYLIRRLPSENILKQLFPDQKIIRATGSDFYLIEFKGDSHPIGAYGEELKPFSAYQINVQKEDLIYIFSDGFADQFGGPDSHSDGKKYKYKKFKTFLLSIANLPMDEQKEKLVKEFEEWKGTHEQLDDLCIIGVRI